MFTFETVGSQMRGLQRYWFPLDVEKYLKFSGSKNILDDKTLIGSEVRINGRVFTVLSLEGGDDEPWGIYCTPVHTESLNELSAICFAASKSKGWWDGIPTFNTLREADPKKAAEFALMKHMLMVTELAEASESVRNSEPDLHYGKASEVHSISGKQYYVVDHGPNELLKPEGEASEIADCLIRIFDYCGYRGWDIESIVRKKIEYNKTRSHMHGGKAV